MSYRGILKLAQQLADSITQTTAITSDEIVAFKNHVIRINKHAQEIEKYLKSLADAAYVSTDGIEFRYSKDDALSLKNFAIQLTDVAQNNGAITSVESAFNQVKTEFDDINKKYLKDDWIAKTNYKPMKEIKESLTYIRQYIDKKKRLDAAATTEDTDQENPTPP